MHHLKGVVRKEWKAVLGSEVISRWRVEGWRGGGVEEATRLKRY